VLSVRHARQPASRAAWVGVSKANPNATPATSRARGDDQQRWASLCPRQPAEKMGALGFALLTPTYGAAGRRRGACARAAAGPADAHAARHPAATMRPAPAAACPLR